MKDALKFAIPLWAFIMAIMYYGVFVMITDPKAKQPVQVQYFNNGDTLFPDMVCPDTLIVTDADGLNKDHALVEQGFIDATDDQIDSVYHLHTISLNK